MIHQDASDGVSMFQTKNKEEKVITLYESDDIIVDQYCVDPVEIGAGAYGTANLPKLSDDLYQNYNSFIVSTWRDSDCSDGQGTGSSMTCHWLNSPMNSRNPYVTIKNYSTSKIRVRVWAIMMFIRKK